MIAPTVPAARSVPAPRSAPSDAPTAYAGTGTAQSGPAQSGIAQTGTAVTAGGADLAASALAEVGRDPHAALLLAGQAVAVSRAHHQVEALSVAHRAAALSWRELGDLVRAEARGTAAVRAAVAGSSRQHESEARMTLAFVLLERGRLRAALHQAELAGSGVAGLSAARVSSQRGLILQRAGRLDEALACYARALPVFRRSDDDLWAVRLLNNRATLHIEQGNLTAAAADLQTAADLLQDTGMTAMAAGIAWNLGLVAAHRGDVPGALARYDAAHAHHAVNGTSNPQLSLDRAEVLLSVGLADEAVAILDQAVDVLKQSGQGADLAQALLVRSRARHAAGDAPGARTDALDARSLFGRQARQRWATVATLAALKASEEHPDSQRQLLADAMACAAEVALAGWPIAEMEARLIAARAAATLGDTATRRSQLELAARHRRSGSVDARLRARFATALLHECDGDLRRARSALSSAMRVLDDHQALLGATELRAHVSVIGYSVVAKGLELALSAGDARQTLVWADRGRARATRPRPVRPPRDPALTAALAQVRRLDSLTVQAELDGGVPPTATERRAAERSVELANRKTAGAGTAVDPGPKELVDALGAAILLEFVEHDGGLLLITVIDGRFHAHRRCSVAAVTAEIGNAQFLLRRLTSGFGSARSQQQLLGAAVDSGARLEALLFGDVLGSLSGRESVVVPSAALHSLPWGALPTLGATPFRVSPSAAAWVRAAGLPQPSPGAPQVYAAGPGLRHADREVTRLSADIRGARVFRAQDARVEDVLSAMDGAGLAHLAAHGNLRVDNPLFSALRLADGPLTVYDIEGLRVAPAVVVLPSCESGASTTRAGDELLGLVAALLSIGTRTVIATAIPTPDECTAELMVTLHARLRTGLPAAHALAVTRRAADGADPLEFATAAGFSCFGA